MDKLSYALGVSVGLNMTDKLGIKEINFDDFNRGVKSVLNHETQEMTMDDINQTLNKQMINYNEIRKALELKEREKNLKEGRAYLAENAKNEEIKTTKSGLQYKVLTKGTGTAQPTAHSRVRVHYEGKLTSGKVFDSSFERGNPVEFGLDQVIPGWTEGVQLMKEGDVFEFTIPSDLGYGPTGVPGHIPGNSVLIFKVELIKVLE